MAKILSALALRVKVRRAILLNSRFSFRRPLFLASGGLLTITYCLSISATYVALTHYRFSQLFQLKIWIPLFSEKKHDLGTLNSIRQWKAFESNALMAKLASLTHWLKEIEFTFKSFGGFRLVHYSKNSVWIMVRNLEANWLFSDFFSVKRSSSKKTLLTCECQAIHRFQIKFNSKSSKSWIVFVQVRAFIKTVLWHLSGVAGWTHLNARNWLLPARCE